MITVEKTQPHEALGKKLRAGSFEETLNFPKKCWLEHQDDDKAEKLMLDEKMDMAGLGSFSNFISNELCCKL